jgi:hypothetical protein
VLGVGTVLWNIVNKDGKEVFLPLVCYHVEYTAICLISQQQSFKKHNGYGKVLNHNITFHLPDHAIINIPTDERLNLPMIWDVNASAK